MFTQTKREADRLAYVMGRSYPCQALHGDISQNQRERTLSGFRDGRFNILVATDVAARGLDIPNVDLVSDLKIRLLTLFLCIVLSFPLYLFRWYIMRFQIPRSYLFTDLGELHEQGRKAVQF